MKQNRSKLSYKGFTLVELLTVIAIIALLAAILFPVFSAAREQARQANTMGNMHDIYLAARTFDEDNGRYPSSLFGYAQPSQPDLQTGSCTSSSPLPFPALSTDGCITSMGSATENYGNQGFGSGYVWGSQMKDLNAFLCSDNPVKNQQQVTIAYYPLTLTGGQFIPVTWIANNPNSSPCHVYGDYDLPNVPGRTYVGQPKLFYTMDSMDIGPMLDQNGDWMKDSNGANMYELHYTPNWTRQLYTLQTNSNGQQVGCDTYSDFPVANMQIGDVLSNQLKYKNPSSEKTILSWNTQHAATAGSGDVIILLLSGTTKKISINNAEQQLPLYYH